MRAYSLGRLAIQARTSEACQAKRQRASYDKEKREALNAWGARLEEIIAQPSGPSQSSPPI